MNSNMYGIIIAATNGDIGGALEKFSGSAVALLNTIIGSLMVLIGVAIVAVLIYYAVKFGHNNVEVAAEAKKRFKAVLISLVICLLILSAGMALINTVLEKIGDAPFDVTGSLIPSISNILC